jgi:hypothetical protein
MPKSWQKEQKNGGNYTNGIEFPALHVFISFDLDQCAPQLERPNLLHSATRQRRGSITAVSARTIKKAVLKETKPGEKRIAVVPIVASRLERPGATFVDEAYLDGSGRE